MSSFLSDFTPTAEEQSPAFLALAEQALWRAVILQQLEDAVCKSRKARDRSNREQARHWLEGKSKDFRIVCDFAGLEPCEVRRKAKKALINGCKWRAEAGQGRHGRNKRLSSPPPDTPAPQAQILSFAHCAALRG